MYLFPFVSLSKELFNEFHLISFVCRIIEFSRGEKYYNNLKIVEIELMEY